MDFSVGRLIFLFFLFLQSAPLLAQRQIYNSEMLSPDVYTLQIRPTNDPYFPPVIELNGSNQIEISFDQLGDEINYYDYSIIHCNSDWTPSQLSELEYLDGFNINSIEEKDYSSNTFTHYVHYSLKIPNERTRFKVSGNYVLKVFPENNPDRPILYACFSIYENLVTVVSNVTSRTDIDYNAAHQQVNVQVNYPHYAISNPATDLLVYVSQNSRRDNQVLLPRPLSMQTNSVNYEHLPNLIFEAGNEYRRFEMVSQRYAGLGVERIRFFDPFYHVTLFPDLLRSNGNYIFDRTQNGRFTIRASDADDSNLEADYFVVHFSLDYDNPLIEGAIYLNGEFTYDRFNEKNKMVYNFDTKKYEKELLLKQGSYNYQYLRLPLNKTAASLALIEGNFYETINEYMVRVYHRRPGERYDRFIGIGRSFSGL